MNKSEIAKKLKVISKKIIGANLVSSVKPVRQHFRIYLNNPLDDEKDIAQQIASEFFEKDTKMFGEFDSSQSGTYKMWRSSEGYDLTIAFGGSAKKGTRGGGYLYEENLVNQLNETSREISSDLIAIPETNVKFSDIIIRVNGQEHYIEAKLENAKFGQPTIWFDREHNRWILASKSRSAENASMVIEILNDFSTSDESINRWMISAIESIEKETGEPIKILSSVNLGVYDLAKSKDRFLQRSPQVSIPSYVINDYYRKKGANWIQIRTKGLYKIGGKTPDVGLGIPDFNDSNVSSWVRCELSTSGDKKVVRATIEVDISGISSSKVDLDDKLSREKFVKAISLKKELNVSLVDETIAGAITPLGTDAQGNPSKKSKKKILDDNAKTQGKSFGNAKPIEEAIDLLSELFE